jgi:hypothetical protein
MKSTLLLLFLAAAPPSPQDTFERLVEAMAAGDEAALARLTTSTDAPRCQPLQVLFSSGDGRRARLRALASSWKAGSIAWETPTSPDTREGFVGPVRPAMTGLCLRRTDGGWRVSGWLPGE